MQLIKCGLCGKKEMPSVWVLIRNRSTRIELGTQCANRLRFDEKHKAKPLTYEIYEQ
jgi:hypothetical protein